MTYRLAAMAFNGDYHIKDEEFENAHDALEFGGYDCAPFVLAVDQSNVVVATRECYPHLIGHTIEDLSVRFAEGLRP